MKVKLIKLLGSLCLSSAIVLSLSANPVNPRMGKSPQHKKRMGKTPDGKQQGTDSQENNKDYASTAQSYLDQAKESDDPTQRGALQLQAAKALLKGKYYEQAKSILAGVEFSSLSETLQYAYNLLAAEVALSEQNPNKALRLATKPDRTTSDDLRIQSYLTRAAAYSQLGNRIQSLKELTYAEEIAHDTERHKVHATIWRTLQRVPLKELKVLPQQAGSSKIAGWIELAIIYKESQLSPDEFNTNLEKWKAKYSNHAAADSIVGTLTSKLKTVQARATKLALLLPLQGRISRASRAIRDGFIAAHFSGSNDRKKIELRIYDTKGQDIVKLYDQAIANGAQFVIGPLLKGNVRRLVRRGSLSVPVLALNIINRNDSRIDNMYFFGLTPEDEARQVAERAIFDNKTQAIAFIPATGWGGRILRAFKERYTQLGGRLLSHATYKTSQSDYAKILKSLLKLDESKNRYNELRIVLNTKIAFTSRRRHDADFIFMAAYPRSARLIVPQLRFYHAKDLPVYATSHAYKGIENKRQDTELNGLMFSDIPWTLSQASNPSAIKQSIVKQWPNKIIDYSRFYALGADSYNIIPYLGWLKDQPFERFEGHTGKLSVDKNNNIKRTLQWAKIIKGKATVIQDRTESSLPRANANNQ